MVFLLPFPDEQIVSHLFSWYLYYFFFWIQTIKINIFLFCSPWGERLILLLTHFHSCPSQVLLPSIYFPFHNTSFWPLVHKTFCAIQQAVFHYLQLLFATFFILNRLALLAHDWRTPYDALYGSTPNMIYHFKFYDHVYCKHVESRGEKDFLN